jgi:hypothetical protein
MITRLLRWEPGFLHDLSLDEQCAAGHYAAP